MYPLVVCATAVYCLVIDRLMALARARGPTRALTDAIEPYLRVGDLGEALSIAAANRGPCARIALRVLREALAPPERAEAARIEALANEQPPLERRVRYLAAMAAVATLFGLLGTVLGMGFQPFTCVPYRDASSKATMLAAGISESMNCLALGLFVSTLALAAYVGVRMAVEARARALDAESKTLVGLLTTHRPRLRWLGQRPSVETLGYRR